MKCKTIHNKLIFFLEGELPEQQMKEVEAHLSRCGECAAFAGDLKKTLAVVQLEKPVAVSQYFYTRLKARMEEQAEGAKGKASLPAWEKALQPALFTVLLLAGIYTGIKIGGNTGSQMHEPAFTQAEVVPYFNEMKTEPLESFLMD